MMRMAAAVVMCMFAPIGAWAAEVMLEDLPANAELRRAFLASASTAASNLLADTERRIGMETVFVQLPDDDTVVARSLFDPARNEARIGLRKNWQDVDVAHELMHVRMDLVDRFCMLAWRRDVKHAPEVANAFGRLQTYVKDELVHARLVEAGFKLDGDVIRPQLFDGVYETAARHLEAGRDRPNDGMAHLDKLGQGNLCRVCFLVQAELLMRNYREQLSQHRIQQTERFISAFRKYRVYEAARADAVLKLFEKYNVAEPEGHRAILVEWTKMAGLDFFVGPSSYEKNAEGRFILPFPK